MAMSPPTVLASGLYSVASVAVLALGIAGAGILYVVQPEIGRVKVEGIAVFAVLYVLAQSIERIVEIVFGFLDWVLGFIATDTTKMRGIQAAAKMRNAPAGSREEAAGKRELEQVKSDRSTLKYCVSFAISLPFAAYIQFSVTEMIGLTGVARWVDILITATAITGGGAALHDLIGKVQSSKEKDKSAMAAAA